MPLFALEEHPLFAFVNTFFAICLLRLAPQELPPSRLLLGVVLSAHILSGMLLWAIYHPLWEGLVAGLLQTLLLAGLTASLLLMQGLQVRFLQTLTALAGTGTLMGLLALLPLYLAKTAEERGQAVFESELLAVFLGGWSLLVTGHILRHALSIHLWWGLILAVTFVGIFTSVMNALLPMH
jgi:hypothetical protein